KWGEFGTVSGCIHCSRLASAVSISSSTEVISKCWAPRRGLRRSRNKASSISLACATIAARSFCRRAQRCAAVDAFSAARLPRCSWNTRSMSLITCGSSAWFIVESSNALGSQRHSSGHAQNRFDRRAIVRVVNSLIDVLEFVVAHQLLDRQFARAPEFDQLRYEHICNRALPGHHGTLDGQISGLQ